MVDSYLGGIAEIFLGAVFHQPLTLATVGGPSEGGTGGCTEGASGANAGELGGARTAGRFKFVIAIGTWPTAVG